MSSRARRVNRRAVIAGIGAAGVLAACAAPAPPTPTSAPAAKPAEAPKPAEAAKLAGEAPKPAADAKAAAAPAAAKPPAAKPGRSLIGKLEGPTIITDPAQFPKELKEPPALAELVKAGKLPPVRERVGEDPLLIKPLYEVGKYGGTWRRGFIGPNDTVNGIRAVQNDKLLYFDYTGQKIVPNIAKGWEVSPDGRTTTLFLRRGMKWSDGQPFTADDFMFWFQDVYQNKDLVVSPSFALTINAKPVTMEKVDTYTVRFRAPDPYFLLPDRMAYGQVGHHARYGRDGLGGFAPAHYLKQFHPKHTSKEELDRKVAEAKVENWTQLFKLRSDSARNPDLPVVTAWKTTVSITTPTWTLERNPYSVYVDSEGNQLPYIDKCVMTLGENLEVINLRAIAGEYDSQARHIDI
ncbi:MAG TPA: ABC transporter substrate-binding protein, partial [Chloroflexota bacterium]